MKNTDSYLFARRTWDFQIARSYRSLLAWRIIAALALVLLTITIFYSYYHISKPKMVPYVITVSEDGSKVDFKGMVKAQKLTVTDSVVRHYIIRFLKDIRTVSTDLVVLKNKLKDAYYITTTDCQRQITEMIGETNPFKMAQEGRRKDIKISVFEKIAESTWRCEWTEYQRQEGVLTDKALLSGTFSYTTAYPENEIEAENNPFGLYFSDFFITEKRY